MQRTAVTTVSTVIEIGDAALALAAAFSGIVGIVVGVVEIGDAALALAVAFSGIVGIVVGVGRCCDGCHCALQSPYITDP